MMDTWVQSDITGKYLYAAAGDESGFEENMIRTIAADCFLLPVFSYSAGRRTICWNIGGLTPLSEYSRANTISAGLLSGIMMQLSGAADILSEHLLNEANILIDADRVFIDGSGGRLKLCLTPSHDADYAGCVRKFVTRLVSWLNPDDSEALKLGFRLLNRVIEGDAMLHDIREAVMESAETVDVPVKPAAAGEQESEAGAAYGTGLPTGGSYSRGGKYHEANRCAEGLYEDNQNLREADIREANRKDCMYGGGDMQGEYTAYDDTAYGDTGGDESMTAGKGMPGIGGLLVRLAAAHLVMAAAMAAVWFIKGAPVLLKVIPAYGVMAVCVTAYFLIDHVLARKRAAG